MKHRNLLVNFDYKTYNLIGVLNNQNLKLERKKQLPLLDIKIDFLAGKLILQADWQFILQYNRHAEERYTYMYKNQVKIQMDIYSSRAIDLDNRSSDGLMFPLEGNIMDISILNACSGMLVLKNTRFNKDRNVWRLAIYIYDHSDDSGEIRFDLPLYLVKEFQTN